MNRAVCVETKSIVAVTCDTVLDRFCVVFLLVLLTITSIRAQVWSPNFLKHARRTILCLAAVMSTLLIGWVR